MLVGIGYSDDRDSARAAGQAAGQAIRASGVPVMTFIFCTAEYAPAQVFGELQKKIGSSSLIGASVPGIIVGAEVKKKGIAVLTISGPDVQAVTCLQEVNGSSSFAQGQKAGGELQESGLEKGTVFIFPDGITINIADYIRGLYDALGNNFSYTGGGTGDNLTFYKPYQFTEQGYSGTAVAAALVKGLDLQVASGHGWEPAGEPMMVTRAAGKTIYELDGLPAFQRYSESMGGISKVDFPRYGTKHPFGIPARKGEFLVRDPLFINEDNSIELGSEMPENTVAMLMKGENSNLIAAAENMARQTMNGGRPRVVFIFECISRYHLMGKAFLQELQVIRKYAGEEAPLFGMLSFGEIASTSGSPLFHNKSLVLAVGE